MKEELAYDYLNYNMINKIITRRTSFQINQETLDKLNCIAYKQLELYKNYSVKISSNTLYRISLVLNTPMTYFYENYHQDHITKSKKELNKRNEIDDIIKIFNNERNKKLSKSLLSFLKAFYYYK